MARAKARTVGCPIDSTARATRSAISSLRVDEVLAKTCVLKVGVMFANGAWALTQMQSARRRATRVARARATTSDYMRNLEMGPTTP